MGNVWIGPWANFPQYMDRTFEKYNEIRQIFPFYTNTGLLVLALIVIDHIPLQSREIMHALANKNIKKNIKGQGHISGAQQSILECSKEQ